MDEADDEIDTNHCIDEVSTLRVSYTLSANSLYKELPFACTKENISKVQKWLLECYTSFLFNQCKHQQLSGDGWPFWLHVDPNAKPSAVHTPAAVPLHWYDVVNEQLDADVAMGIIEKVPIEEPSAWCNRIIIALKSDGTCMGTVNLSLMKL